MLKAFTDKIKWPSPAQPVERFHFTEQLSGLRFCAIIFVVVYHFSESLMNFRGIFDLGVLIVFFFVLSSYLITRVLLDARDKALEKGYGQWKVGLAFLVRRTLRIFPAYYLYLFILFLLPVEAPEIREHLRLFILYLSNVLLYIQKGGGPLTAHLWTLAVEEQFYIVWPWLILFIPLRHLPKLFLALALAAIAFRVTSVGRMHDYVREIFPMLVLTPAALDSFAAGGMLAFAHYYGYTQKSRTFLWGSLALIPVLVFFIVTNHRRTFVAVDRLFVSVWSAAIIHKANRGYGGFAKKMLENRVVQYMSRISYGIYLYHMLAIVLFWKWFDALAKYLLAKGIVLASLRHTLESPYIYFWINLAIAIGMATLSWYLVESPFNKAKKLFEYVRSKRVVK